MERSRRLISLGTDCSVGLAFKDLGVKEETFPFDWTVSHYRWVHQQINHRLAWQIDGASLRVTNPAEPYVVADEPRGIFYYHDFPPGQPFAPEVAVVTDKYRRRADRLRELLDSGAPVLFARAYRGEEEEVSGGTTRQIEELANLIADRFPAADFRIDMLYSNEGPAPTDPRVSRLKLPTDRREFKRAVLGYVRENDPRVRKTRT